MVIGLMGLYVNGDHAIVGARGFFHGCYRVLGGASSELSLQVDKDYVLQCFGSGIGRDDYSYSDQVHRQYRQELCNMFLTGQCTLPYTISVSRTECSQVFSCVFSYLIFNMPLGGSFLIGVLVVLSATHLYSNGSEKLNSAFSRICNYSRRSSSMTTPEDNVLVDPESPQPTASTKCRAR